MGRGAAGGDAIVSESQPAPFLGAKTATFLCLGLLVGVGGVTAFSVIDRPKRAAAESFSQTTAVGDTNYFHPQPPRFAIPEPVLTWEGRPWAPTHYEKLKTPDSQMQPAGKDPASGLTVYHRRNSPDEGHVYLKMDIGEYLTLDPR